jgi:hypothetical protein
MALLSQLIRNVAITGSTDHVNAWFAGRQGGRWAEQTVRAAFPTMTSSPQRAPSDPARALADLADLHRGGVVTDAEFESLRARLRG